MLAERRAQKTREKKRQWRLGQGEQATLDAAAASIHFPRRPLVVMVVGRSCRRRGSTRGRGRLGAVHRVYEEAQPEEQGHRGRASPSPSG